MPNQLLMAEARRLASAIHAMKAENVALKAALKPFAQVMDWLEEMALEGRVEDLSNHVWAFRIDAGPDSIALTVGKFRAARDALRKGETP